MKLFNSVIHGKQIGDGTRGALIRWLEQYVNLLFPDNGIEYWSHGAYNQAHLLSQSIPGHDGENGVLHFACFVRKGRSEGRIIDIIALCKDSTYLPIAWIKTFGKTKECWDIAAAVSEAMESIHCYEEVPEIIFFAGLLPKAQPWHRETSLKESVQVIRTDTLLTVKTDSQTLWQVDYSEHCVNAGFYLEPRLEDWKTVLKNMHARFEIVDLRGPSKEPKSV